MHHATNANDDVTLIFKHKKQIYKQADIYHPSFHMTDLTLRIHQNFVNNSLLVILIVIVLMKEI